MTSVLVYKGVLSGWNHAKIVYKNKTPNLYINSKFVKSGLTSIKSNINASLLNFTRDDFTSKNGIGGGYQSFYEGKMK